MNQPYILQRFDLQGSSLLIIEGTKFQMEPCSAVAYLAIKPDADKDELVLRMKNALEGAYGKQMEIIVSKSISIEDGKSIPSAILAEMRELNYMPFINVYIPKVDEVKMYSCFYKMSIPFLSMTLFVPNGHQKYFDARSVYLNYTDSETSDKWESIASEVAELQKQCIPGEVWFPKQ